MDTGSIENELAAMQAMVGLFDGLDDAARKRLLAWAADRYKVEVWVADRIEARR